MTKIEKKRSIGLAAKELFLPDHVIRFWETQFPQHIRPSVGKGGRRYYFDKDVLVIKNIKFLLYEAGYTIKGLKRFLSKNKSILKKNTSEVRKIANRSSLIMSGITQDEVNKLADVSHKFQEYLDKF